MHPNHTAPPVRETLRERLERDARAIADLLRDPRADELVLEPYGEGYAWLRPQRSIDDEPRYWITDAGRRALREADTFDKGPSVAEAYGIIAWSA